MSLGVQAPSGNWCHLFNYAVGGTGTNTGDCRSIWYAILRVLCNLDGSSSWLDGHGAACTAPTACSVVYSCDGSGSASYCGADNYIDGLPDLICAPGGTNHSYYVLRFPGMGSTFDLLFDYAGSSSYYYGVANSTEKGATPTSIDYGGIYVSQSGGGFVSNGGLVTRRCWAANEVQIMHRTSRSYVQNSSIFGGVTAAFNGKLHFSRKSDGSSTRIVLCISGYPVWYLFVEKPLNPVHTETSPTDYTWNGDNISWVAASDWMTSLANVFTRANWFNTVDRWVTRLASYSAPTTNTLCELRWTTWMNFASTNYYNVDLQETSRSQINNAYNPFPIGWNCHQAGNQHPLIGSMEDAYMVGSNLTTGLSGAMDASSAGYEYVVLGNLMIPKPYGVAVQLS
jgi:hypothetical protein